MAIYAIGDLHLSGEPAAKPMEVFGPHWQGHKDKIKAQWLNTVSEEDLVLLCGDTSWAMSLEGAGPDLEWISQLPGKKLLLRGNHDYWWTSLKKMQAQWGQRLGFLQNDAIYLHEGVAICGTRGWLLPSSEVFTPQDQKYYQREALRLELALKAARATGAATIIAALHYPPLFQPEEETLFTQLLESYGVGHCVFAHIHGEMEVSVYQGQRRGVSYKLVSCDTQGFRLYKIL